MKSHLEIQLNQHVVALDEDFSISVEEKNPMFYENEMYSQPISIPLDGNRDIFNNIDVPQADTRLNDLENLSMKIRVDGMPHKSGVAKICSDEHIENAVTLNMDASVHSLKDLIGSLECRDIPVKDKIKIGEKIGNVKLEVQYNYKVNVHYFQGKKTQWSEYVFEDGDAISGVFEPQALGFSYPGICEVTGDKQEAVVASKASYADGNELNIPSVLTKFINVSDPYPDKPYCNARIAYLHRGAENGKTVDALPTMDSIDDSAREEHYPYWVLDADRPQSGICFYVLYFLDCLFEHLGVAFDKDALLAVEDFKHLCFFTTHHKYYTEQEHGTDEEPFFTAEADAGYYRPAYLMPRKYTVTPQVWEQLSNEEFNKELFDDINTWLESRGCGGQLVLSYPSPKNVSDFDYEKNGVKEHIEVGKQDVDSIKIEASVRHARVSSNILSMYASSDNFPDESVKTVLDSLEASFGIKFHYDEEQKKVTAYLLRDIFRSQEEPIDFCGMVKSMYKVSENNTGIRMAYSAESERKEQEKNVRRGIKDYNTDYDYIDYKQDQTVTDLTYQEIINLPKSQQKENLLTYVDITTGNTYRWKTSRDSLASGEYKISLFEVASFKGVELGDCSSQNKNNIVEFISNFEPVSFNDVNYRISEIMVQGDVSKTVIYEGDTYTVSNFNQDGYSPLLAAFIDEDMEHEFVPQYINNSLPSAFVDIYLTEQLKLVESYDPSKTEDGNSPLQEIDWGLSIAMMRGGGSDSVTQLYDYNYDLLGNSRWRRVPGEYAMTSDSLDLFGNGYDYNGAGEGDGGGERFSLKIRSWQQPKWSDSPLIVDDEKDGQGNVTKKIRTRGLCDSFQMEHFDFLLNRKKFNIEVEATAAELDDISNHWSRRFRINGQVGWIGKISYNVHIKNGIQNAMLEFYSR